MTLDHINGDNTDARLENLRWVCPNCDRQLPTFGARNFKYKKEKYICKECTKIKTKENKKELCKHCSKDIKNLCPVCKTNLKLVISKVCAECNKKMERNKKIEIKREELKILIRTKTFVEIGKMYNVTDNAIRKWCKKYNLPYKSSEIKKYTDEEWKNI